MQKKLKHPIFDLVSKIVTAKNQRAFVIGGFVRDLLLNRDSKDIDIVVLGSGIDLAKEVASKTSKYTKVSVFKNFGTAMLMYKDYEIEFVGARKESYQKNSRNPTIENGTLEDDQKRRDFTINALAIGLHKDEFGKLIDPFNGINDLKNKLIRTPLEAEETFSDDPLRMMRAIRFATQLNFNIEKDTLKAINTQKERIKIISKERINEELHKILLCDKPSIGFKILDKTELLKLIFPELDKLKGIDIREHKAHKDVFLHTLKVLDNIAETNNQNLWLRWAALLHDIAKPITKKFIKNAWTFHGHDAVGEKIVPKIFKRMRLPMNEKMKYVQKLVALHLRPIILAKDIVTDSAVRRLLFEVGEEANDLMILCDADITSKNEIRVKKYLNNFKLVRQKFIEIEEKDKIRNFQPPISGEIIMKTFNLKPCRKIGIIKNAIKDAILDGIIENDYQQAFDFMIKEAKKLNLRY